MAAACHGGGHGRRGHSPWRRGHLPRRRQPRTPRSGEESYGGGAAHQNYFTHWTGRRGTVVEVKLEQIVCGILAFRTPDAASSPWLIPAADQHLAKQMPNTRQQQSKKRKRS